MKISINGYITCKKSENYSDCADNYSLNVEYHKFAISDGVGKSYFPKIWSDVLVRKYTQKKDWVESEFIDECQKEWQTIVDKIVAHPETKWYTKVDYNRKTPGFATFVGLQFFEKEKKWIASSIGDSFLFFVPQDYKDFEKEAIKFSSKSEPIIFDNFPDYLSSIGESHKGMPLKTMEGDYGTYGTFYLMTDALSEWFIKEKKEAIEMIKTWETQEDFEDFINLARDENKLSDDDSAILIISLENDDKIKISYDKINVSCLSDMIKRQNNEVSESKQVLETDNILGVREETEIILSPDEANRIIKAAAEEEIEANKRAVAEEIEANKRAAEEEIEANKRAAEEEIEANKRAAEEEIEANKRAAEEEIEANKRAAKKKIEARKKAAKKDIETSKKAAEEEIGTNKNDKIEENKELIKDALRENSKSIISIVRRWIKLIINKITRSNTWKNGGCIVEHKEQ